MNRYYLSQLNYEGSCFAEGFLHNLCPCFDIAFAQLGVIPRTRNTFDEIVPIAEYYLTTNHVKNKESKKHEIKGKKIFRPNLQYFQFGQDGWKTFFMKIS